MSIGYSQRIEIVRHCEKEVKSWLKLRGSDDRRRWILFIGPLGQPARVRPKAGYGYFTLALVRQYKRAKIQSPLKLSL